MQTFTEQEIMDNGLSDINVFPYWLKWVGVEEECDLPFIKSVVKTQDDLDGWLELFDGDIGSVSLAYTTVNFYESKL